jgi:UDP-N-acetylglucosamine 2-epimerase (non-hydrolysing)
MCVVGARPNFVKVAPILAEFRRHQGVEAMLVHTGQHYDEQLSSQLFTELELPEPDAQLGIGAGPRARQIAKVIQRLDPIVEREAPDFVLVVGDVDSTMAAALVAAGRMVPLIHVEAGLRSFDRTMPEEINRIVTDALSDLLFVTEESAIANLEKEGIAGEKVHFAGNVMIDTLLRHRERAHRSDVLERLGLVEGRYAAVTLHRPSNVDHPDTFGEILAALREIAEELPIAFPCHPRTRDRLARFGLEHAAPQSEAAGCASTRRNGLVLTDPLGYLDFIRLADGAALILTDSGGVQEEATALGVPCLTLRENTERPVTLTHGTNTLTGCRRPAIVAAARKALAAGRPPSRELPPLWDGHAAERIVQRILRQRA